MTRPAARPASTLRRTRRCISTASTYRNSRAPCSASRTRKAAAGWAAAAISRLKPGMVYSISPTLVDEKTGEALLGGGSLAVTDNGYRDLGAVRAVEMVVAG